MRVVPALTIAFVLAAGSARAADEPPKQDAPKEESINLTKDTAGANATAEDPNAPPPEAPPPLPYKKTFVIDSSLGAMAFFGQIGKIMPPGPWMHTQLGYELLSWLMLYGEGELAFTDTSNKLDPPKTRTFPIFGFGGGVRFTIRFTDRVGIYAQPGFGLMKCDVATNGLGILGFRGAETLDIYFGGRLGFEWYQIDRHFALGVTVGARLAQGFARIGGPSDTPLVGDSGLSLRYAF